jgi:hypothetical protein
MAQHQLTTLQIATFGSEGQDGIALGIRSFPVHKLVLICFGSDKGKAEEFSSKIRKVLGLPVTITLVKAKCYQRYYGKSKRNSKSQF